MNPKIFALHACVMFFFITSYTNADTPESCLLFSIASKSNARLGIVNTNNHSLQLEIINANGEIFFSKTVSGKQNYFQLLDLSNMPDGKYNVKLKGESTEFGKGFTISNHKVEIQKKSFEQRPLFKMIDNEILAVSYLNKTSGYVNILFELNNEIIFEDRNISQTPVSKRYSLKQLPKGDYIVKLYSGDQSFSYPMAIK
jgi:hypothetical protein